MLPLAHLSASQQASFEDALVAGDQQLEFKAQLFNKNGAPLSTELLLHDGEVLVDASNPRDTVSRTAHVTFLDPDRRLPVDGMDAGSGASWFSKQLGLWWCIWVSEIDDWVRVPVFRGWIFDVARRGIQVDVDAQGKEAGHLPPAVFPHSFSIRKGTKISDAIKDILRRRGEDDFAVEHTYRGLNRDRTWGVGQSPWRTIQNLASSVDKQAYFRGNGQFVLRDHPTQPVWVFTEGEDALLLDDAEERVSRGGVVNQVIVRGEGKPIMRDVERATTMTAKSLVGATSIVVANAADFAAGRRIEIGGKDGDPEIRKIDAAYASGTTIPLSSPLARAHPTGAPVRVRYRTDKPKTIIGRAKLEQHPLSAENLSDGKRPLIHIEDRPRIHHKANADAKAEAVLDRKKRGLEDEISIRCVTVPHLEEGDRIAVDVNGRRRTFRIKRFSIPLNLDGEQEINWLGALAPERPGGGGRGTSATTTSEIPTIDSAGPSRTVDGVGGGTPSPTPAPVGSTPPISRDEAMPGDKPSIPIDKITPPKPAPTHTPEEFSKKAREETSIVRRGRPRGR